MDNQIKYPDDEYLDIEPAEWEKVAGKCEFCKTETLEACGFQNGPDDYDWSYRCIKCGDVFNS
jgi:hypothetical protein